MMYGQKNIKLIYGCRGVFMILRFIFRFVTSRSFGFIFSSVCDLHEE